MSVVGRRAGITISALALILGRLLLSGSVATAQGADPVVVLDRTGTAAGEAMLVTGQRWPEASMLVVQLCGHGGLRGTVDCDVANQRTAGVGPSGQFSVELFVAPPPVPCPCVVKVTDQSTQVSATAPIAVAGIPTVPLTARDLPVPRSVEISSIHIKGGQRIAELFGAGGRRVLELTLVNTGPQAVDAPRVSIAWGRGTSPDGFVKPPVTSRLEPGQTQTLTVALDRPALTLGSQTALVEIQGIGESVTARAKTSAYPWGLLVIALSILQLALLWVRNRVRHRIASNPEAPRVELAGAVLELTAPSPALAPASVATGTQAEAGQQVIDLDAVDRVDHAAPPPEAQSDIDVAGVNGSTRFRGDGVTPVPGSTGLSPIDDVASVRVELVELRRQAQTALDRARELAAGCTDATERRVRDIEDVARSTLRAAEDSRSDAVAALAAARARAEKLFDEATNAVAATTTTTDALLHRATADRDAALRALEDVRREWTELLDAAMEAVEEVLREIDDRAQGLVDELAQAPAASEPLVAAITPRPQVLRVDDLDGRLAHAISRAFASVRSDRTSAD